MLFLVIAMVVLPCGCQPELERFNRKARPMHQDVPHLLCATCKLAVEEMVELAASARKQTPGGKVGEDDLIEIGERICDPDTDEGEWISMYDVSQDGKGRPLKLEKQEYLGECRRECRTIAASCAKVFDEFREDLAEVLWKDPTVGVERLASRVCSKWSRVCPANQVPASYERRDEWWMPMDEDSFKMREMEKQLNRLSEKAGSQPVKFVDPMGGMMMGSDGWDEEDEEWADPMSRMMEDFAGHMGAPDEEL